MYEKLTQCPSCGTSSLHNHLICKDHSVSKESFAIVKCEQCELLFTNPRPTKESIGKYYEAQDYISHSNSSKSIVNKIYKIVRSFSLKNKIKIAEQLTSDKNILDFGCGTGHFLTEAKKHNWKIKGVEPNKAARELANQQLDGKVYPSLEELDKNEKYSIITLWHVLEHVLDLNTTLDTLKSLLSKDGIMIIAVPNPDSYDAQYYKEYWAGYDVPRHLYHFNKKSLIQLLKKHSLKLVETLPMKFDSFYVSLLSEKYKSGYNNFIKSFINGYKSNSYARKNSDKYSSIIYILKQK
jgi:2-polyprenyl-3-methyl-5-hydroxy-6-metoxy-1,4-benzoquinol methylase